MENSIKYVVEESDSVKKELCELLNEISGFDISYDRVCEYIAYSMENESFQEYEASSRWKSNEERVIDAIRYLRKCGWLQFVVFMQDSDADEAFEYAEKNAEESLDFDAELIKYLSQWDIDLHEDPIPEDWFQKQCGTSARIFNQEEYVLVDYFPLSAVGLYKILQ